MTTVILFVLGAIIGSFLNVLALRLHSGLSLGGRSRCLHCGERLKAHELIPLLSFFFSGRRCRSCLGRLSWQYPLVEAATGVVFATLFDPQLPIFQNALILAVFSLYIAITVYDLRHKVIPDKLAYPAAALALLSALISPGGPGDFAAGPALFAFFALLWLLSRGRAMGFGDAKLALSVGWLLGLAQGFSAIVLAFWIGAALSLPALLLSRKKPLSLGGKKITIKSEIPFAPFIVLGAWLSLVFSIDLLNVSNF